MSEKFDKAIKLLNEVKIEKENEQTEVRKKILDKLSNKDCNYYLILKDISMDINFKVYGMVVDNYNLAYQMCEDLIDDESEYWLLHKDEVANLMFNIENKTIVRKDKNA